MKSKEILQELSQQRYFEKMNLFDKIEKINIIFGIKNQSVYG